MIEDVVLIPCPMLYYYHRESLGSDIDLFRDPGQTQDAILKLFSALAADL